jgi:hypothetical protein
MSCPFSAQCNLGKKYRTPTVIGDPNNASMPLTFPLKVRALNSSNYNPEAQLTLGPLDVNKMLVAEHDSISLAGSEPERKYLT